MEEVPDFLTPEECDAFIKLVDQPRDHVQNFTDVGTFENRKWVDQELADRFVSRLGSPCRANKLIMSGKYRPGDSFCLHTDTGLYYNSDTGEKTRWTLLVYLNDDFEGGETVFYDESFRETRRVIPKKGKALVFDIDLWHKGNEVRSGVKYWIGCEIIGLLQIVDGCSCADLVRKNINLCGPEGFAVDGHIKFPGTQ